MIEAIQLRKRYAGRTAVDAVSFHINAGEIVAFLGPNGAGKTTILRMLTGYLPPSSGRVTVAGIDVMDHPLPVRRLIGYLPEGCPLYPEMRVAEFLRFRAQLKGVPTRAARSRTAEVLEQCGLTDTGNRIIGQLSKGYRQRVGIADALVHNPDLLVLDEPTIGLDPHQLREIRDLIRQLGSRRTVLLSTHILSEAEAICHRVLIMDRGRIVASDTPADLHRRLAGTEIDCELIAPPAEAEAGLRELEGVSSVQVAPCGGDWHRYTLRATAQHEPRAAIFDLATRRGWRLRELARRRHSLEDVFVALTSHHGTDGEAAP